MKPLHPTVVVCGLLLTLLAGHPAWADVLNMGGTRDPASWQWTGIASLEFVTVGDPGNAADTLVMSDGTTGYGSVGYTYRMGKYDVTAAQYCQFLNAVAKADTYGLYNMFMAPGYSLPPNFGITQSGGPGSYAYNVAGNPNFPMIEMAWGDAARFCNWLSNGQPTGIQGPGTTETGSYTLNGATSNVALMAITRNPGTTYALPTENEWYKSAYYKGGGPNAGYWLYATQSNSAPSSILSPTGTNNANYSDSDHANYLTTVGAFAGSPSAYGTFDQAGDVLQWNEAKINNYYRGRRGGSYGSEATSPQPSYRDYYASAAGSYGYAGGFRVVQVPEPATLSLLALGGLLLARRRRA